jgi:hypothetical protein
MRFEWGAMREFGAAVDALVPPPECLHDYGRSYQIAASGLVDVTPGPHCVGCGGSLGPLELWQWTWRDGSVVREALCFRCGRWAMLLLAEKGALA